MSKALNYGKINTTMTSIMDILLTSRVLYLIAAGLGLLLAISFAVLLALVVIERRVVEREI